MRAALEGLPGVKSVTVDLETGTATATGERPLDPAELERAVEGKVILAWARAFLARLPIAGKDEA